MSTRRASWALIPAACLVFGLLLAQELAPRQSAPTPATANGSPTAFVASESASDSSVTAEARVNVESGNGGDGGTPLVATPASTTIARVEGERPIPPADSQAKLSQPGATGDGTNAGSTPAPSATTSLQSAAIAAGWPAELAAWVERVALCESSGSTAAVSSAGYVGLMQVAPWLHGPVPADAVGQLAQAYGVYQAQGAGAWPTCGS
jgi:hypothetical protein